MAYLLMENIVYSNCIGVILSFDQHNDLTSPKRQRNLPDFSAPCDIRQFRQEKHNHYNTSRPQFCHLQEINWVSFRSLLEKMTLR
jgi:hypothetical protein